MKQVGWVPAIIGNKTKRYPNGVYHAMAFRLYAKPYKKESQDAFEKFNGRPLSEYPDMEMVKVYIQGGRDGEA